MLVCVVSVTCMYVNRCVLVVVVSGIVLRFRVRHRIAKCEYGWRGVYCNARGGHVCVFCIRHHAAPVQIVPRTHLV